MAFKDWFMQEPASNVGFFQNLRYRAHVAGRAEFAKSFASGGFASMVYAPTRQQMITAPWRRRTPVGSEEYFRRLRQLQALPGNLESPGIKQAIRAGARGAPRGTASKLLGLGLMGGLVAAPFFTTEGDIPERTRAATVGAVGFFAGWHVGSKVGMGLGAAAGSFIPVLGQIGIGGAVGGAVGWLAGGIIGDIVAGSVAEAVTRIPDNLVESERRKRRLDWGAHSATFHTQRSHTMRQQSLQMMNRGMMSGRSLMGREAMFVHT